MGGRSLLFAAGVGTVCFAAGILISFILPGGALAVLEALLILAFGAVYVLSTRR